jgi:hypothetical protein
MAISARNMLAAEMFYTQFLDTINVRRVEPTEILGSFGRRIVIE